MQFNQLNEFLDRCISTVPIPLHGSKCQGWQKMLVSRSLSPFLHTQVAWCGNCASELPFKVREEIASIIVCCQYLFVLFLSLRGKSLGLAEKSRVGWETISQPNFHFGLSSNSVLANSSWHRVWFCPSTLCFIFICLHEGQIENFRS